MTSRGSRANNSTSRARKCLIRPISSLYSENEDKLLSRVRNYRGEARGEGPYRGQIFLKSC
jgi:hypothetical protein